MKKFVRPGICYPTLTVFEFIKLDASSSTKKQETGLIMSWVEVVQDVLCKSAKYTLKCAPQRHRISVLFPQVASFRHCI